MNQPDAFRALGAFMIAWSSFETVIEVAIKNQLGVNDQVGEITTSSLGFMSKSSILTSLLQLSNPKHEEAIKLLNQIVGDAKRNAIVHGRVFMDTDGKITFIKSNVSSSYRAKKATFTPEELNNHALKLSSDAAAFQSLLGISESDLANFAHIGYSKSLEI
ncbi:MAG: hypothetical protein ACTHOH_01910 [Lysobacteraceae bacterium]